MSTAAYFLTRGPGGGKAPIRSLPTTRFASNSTVGFLPADGSDVLEHLLSLDDDGLVLLEQGRDGGMAQARVP